MHLVVNLKNGLWKWEVLVLASDELQSNTSISEWMMDLVVQLVRLGTT